MWSVTGVLNRFCHAPLRLGVFSDSSQLQCVRTAMTKKKKKPPKIKPPVINGTYVLRRKREPRLHKVGAEVYRPLKSRFNVYEVEEVIQLTEPVKVILRDTVLDIGVKGQVVDVEPLYAHEELLLTGRAVYATKYNIERYAEDVDRSFSTVSAYFTKKRLSEFSLAVDMSAETPWVLEKWHVRAAFRRAGVWMTDDCIALPPETIQGPDPSNEKESFLVHVTINNREVAPVQAKIRLCQSNQKILTPENNGIMERSKRKPPGKPSDKPTKDDASPPERRLWRKPWRRAKVHFPTTCYTKSSSNYSPVFAGPSNIDAVGPDCLYKLLLLSPEAPSLSAAAAAAFSIGAVIVTVAAAGVEGESVELEKNSPGTSSPKQLSIASTSEPRLKTLEDEAVSAALAAAAATAAAAAERARIAAKAALSMQAEQEMEAAKALEDARIARQMTANEDARATSSGPRSQTPEQSSGIASSLLSKRRRMPKSRPPPRTNLPDNTASTRPSGNAPVHSRPPPPMVSPRFAARLVELVSTASPVAQTFPSSKPTAKIGRTSVCRGVTKSTLHQPASQMLVESVVPPSGVRPSTTPAAHGTSRQAVSKAAQPEAPLSASQSSLTLSTATAPLMKPQLSVIFDSPIHASQDEHSPTTASPSNSDAPSGEQSADSRVTHQPTATTQPAHLLTARPTTASSPAVNRIASPPTSSTTATLPAVSTITTRTPDTTSSNVTHVLPSENVMITSPSVYPRGTLSSVHSPALHSYPQASANQRPLQVLNNAPGQDQCAPVSSRSLPSWNAQFPQRPTSAGGVATQSVQPPLSQSPVMQTYPASNTGPVPHVTLAMLPNPASGQWSQKQAAEGGPKVTQVLTGQRPQSLPRPLRSAVAARGQIRTSISTAVSLDPTKSPDTSVAWTTAKIAGPADDTPAVSAVPENADPTLTGITWNNPTSWLYPQPPTATCQPVPTQWSCQTTAFNSSMVDGEQKLNRNSWTIDPLRFGATSNPTVLTGQVGTALWEAGLSSSSSSLPQAYIPVDSIASHRTNNPEIWRSKLPPSSIERGSPSVQWNKNTAYTYPVPQRTDLAESQTTWYNLPQPTDSVRWLQTQPLSDDKGKDQRAEDFNVPIQQAKSTSQDSYQKAFYGQTLFVQTLDAYPQQMQQQRQQQHFPETVLEEASVEGPQ